MKAHLSVRDYENLSAYLDGQLSPAEKTRLEERMRANTELRLAYDEMNRARSLLRNAPRRRAPRNFTLTPAMVQARQRRTGSFFQFFPALSFASALAALALVLSFVFETGPIPSAMTEAPSMQAGRLAVESTAEAAEMPAAEPMLAAEAAPESQQDMAQKSAAPGAMAAQDQSRSGPIITWGFPSASPFQDGRGGGMPAGGDGFAYGRGGMGGGGGMDSGTVFGMGGGALDGNLVLPLDSIEGLDAGDAEMQAAPPVEFEGIPTLEGSGPILGVPRDGHGGQYLQPLATPLPPQEFPAQEQAPVEPESSIQAPDIEPEQPGLFGLPQLRVVQILLGMLALVTGAAAVGLWLKNR